MAEDSNPITLGTLANIIKHSDVLCDLLAGANETQWIAAMKRIVDDPALRGRLMRAVDGLGLNVRVLKMAEIGTGSRI
jgi:hypothetical protein